ncbi:hypothetical protein AB6A40_000043 [Gnathostoma spinigerum]|uniref:Uncharacterized protein n=1 Tax=Gnathostoma spinigerum TaxID=75299 RepID=A0ABD6E195_9BILA
METCFLFFVFSLNIMLFEAAGSSNSTYISSFSFVWEPCDDDGIHECSNMCQKGRMSNGSITVFKPPPPTGFIWQCEQGRCVAWGGCQCLKCSLRSAATSVIGNLAIILPLCLLAVIFK